MRQELILNCLKNKVRAGIPIGFSGLGIIILTDDDPSLPIYDLLKEKEDLSAYKNENEMVDFLFDISKRDDKRHDGFHVVSLKEGLLYISQYFSPPIPKSLDSTIYNIGARHRAAQYGSLCKNVSLIIIVGQSGMISKANNGLVEILSNE